MIYYMRQVLCSYQKYIYVSNEQIRRRSKNQEMNINFEMLVSLLLWNELSRSRWNFAYRWLMADCEKSHEKWLNTQRRSGVKMVWKRDNKFHQSFAFLYIVRKLVCIWLTWNCLFPQWWNKKNANNYIEKPIPNCYYSRKHWTISNLKGKKKNNNNENIHTSASNNNGTAAKNDRERARVTSKKDREWKNKKRVEAIKCSFPICAMCDVLVSIWYLVNTHCL